VWRPGHLVGDLVIWRAGGLHLLAQDRITPAQIAVACARELSIRPDLSRAGLSPRSNPSVQLLGDVAAHLLDRGPERGRRRS
jgi:hypothetical protein